VRSTNATIVEHDEPRIDDRSSGSIERRRNGDRSTKSSHRRKLRNPRRSKLGSIETASIATSTNRRNRPNETTIEIESNRVSNVDDDRRDDGSDDDRRNRSRSTERLDDPRLDRRFRRPTVRRIAIPIRSDRSIESKSNRRTSTTTSYLDPERRDRRGDDRRGIERTDEIETVDAEGDATRVDASGRRGRIAKRANRLDPTTLDDNDDQIAT